MTTNGDTAVVPATVLAFWFGSSDAVDARWFKGGAAFDREIGQRFGATTDAALDGRLDAWGDSNAGTLALLLVLDQFTRNVHRGTPRAFAGDARALALAQRLLATGAHRELSLLQRWFAYMPLEHAEDLALQRQCVQLFEALVADAAAAGSPHAAALDSALDYARRHHDVIARFGRFPHRNAILGRVGSAEELSFLQQPGSSF